MRLLFTTGVPLMFYQTLKTILRYNINVIETFFYLSQTIST